MAAATRMSCDSVHDRPLPCAGRMLWDCCGTIRGMRTIVGRRSHETDVG
jgi:hypothetical protein